MLLLKQFKGYFRLLIYILFYYFEFNDFIIRLLTEYCKVELQDLFDVTTTYSLDYHEDTKLLQVKKFFSFYFLLKFILIQYFISGYLSQINTK